jgi:hypothetical protein
LTFSQRILDESVFQHLYSAVEGAIAMRFTLCKILLLPALAAATGFASQSARAESVNVPFEFTAHGHSFPSGTYAVEQSPSRHTVTLHAIKGHAAITWMMGAGPESSDARVVLQFGQIGGTHVLKSVSYGHQFSVEDHPSQVPATHGQPARP